ADRPRLARGRFGSCAFVAVPPHVSSGAACSFDTDCGPTHSMMRQGELKPEGLHGGRTAGQLGSVEPCRTMLVSMRGRPPADRPERGSPDPLGAQSAPG